MEGRNVVYSTQLINQGKSDPPSPYLILDRLENVQLEGRNAHGQPQWSARCPVHDDSRNSLAVSIGSSGGVILMCHACGPSATGDILKAVGGTWSDLFPNDQYEAYQRNGINGINGHANGSSGRPKKTPSKHDAPAAEKKIVATYDYRDESGDLQFQVVRYEPKDFRQRRPTGNPAKPWEWNLHNVKIVPYHLPQLIAADPSIPVLIPEGEKDVENLEKGKFVATCNPMGAGGAGKWLPSFNEYLAGRHVVLIPDNDPDAKPGDPEAKAFIGQKHMAYIAAQLKGIAASIRILNLPNLPIKGDVTDWINAGGTPQQLKQLILDCPLLDDSTAPAAPAVLPVEAEDDPSRLANLFLESMKDVRTGYKTYRYHRDVWHWWNGLNYQMVPEKEMRAMVWGFVKSEFNRLNITDQESGKFNEDGSAKVARKVSNNLIGNVMSDLAATCLISDSVDQPAIIEPDSDLDGDARDYIATQNWLINTKAYCSDEPEQLSKVCRLPTPAYFSSVALPCKFEPKATCPIWNSFLERNLEGDEQLANILQEFFGYCLTQNLSFQKFLLLKGRGANGKSVICALLTALLGEQNVSHVPLESFGERFALNATVGKLANIVSEIGEIDKFAEGALKSFTAGERMMVDRKNKSILNVPMTAKLVMATNNLPRVTDRSDGIWRRTLLIPLNVQIPDHEKVIGMDTPGWWNRAQEKSGELSGILNWALTGLAELQRFRKFTRSQKSEDALSEFKEDVNPAAQFLREHYKEERGSWTPSKSVFDAYADWCKANNNKPLNSRNFGKEVFNIFPATGKGLRGERDGTRFRTYINIRRIDDILDVSEISHSFDDD